MFSLFAIVPTFFLIAIEPQPSMQSETGVVRGIVVNSEGKSIGGANVWAKPVGVLPFGDLPQAMADSEGRFEISLKQGCYYLSAAKETEGYGHVLSKFQDRLALHQTTCIVPENSPPTQMVLIEPKAGTLIGTVVDAVNGQRLSPCAKILWREGKSAISVSDLFGSDSFRLLVPSNSLVQLKVWLDGYQPWFYPGTSVQYSEEGIHLQAGQEEYIQIRLQPHMDSGESHCQALIGDVGH